MILSPSAGPKQRDRAWPVAGMEVAHGLRQVVGLLVGAMVRTILEELPQLGGSGVEVAHHGVGQALGVLPQLVHPTIAAGEAVALGARHPAVDER